MASSSNLVYGVGWNSGDGVLPTLLNIDLLAIVLVLLLVKYSFFFFLSICFMLLVKHTNGQLSRDLHFSVDYSGML